MNAFKLPLQIAFIACISLVQGQNNCLEFDGANDRVAISKSLQGNNALTIEAWVYLHSFNPQTPDNYISNVAGHDDASALVRIGDEDPSHMIDDNRAQIALKTTNGIDKSNSTTEMLLNTWYHVAGTYDGSNIRIYVNGILEDTEPHSGLILTSATIINIGGQSSNSRYFDGFIDEVRIWNVARTAIQIRQTMYLELAGNENGLLAYYKLNESSGLVANDASGNGYNGVLTNMAGNEWQASGAIFGPKNCLDFDGENDYVSLGNSASLRPQNELTLECWLNADNWNPSAVHQVFAGNTQSGGYNFAIGYPTANHLGFAVYSNGQYRRVDAAINGFAGWHHVAGTFDGQYVKVFVDGVEQNSYDMGSAGNTIFYSYSNSFLLGNEAGSGSTPPSNSYCYDGKMDEFRVWSVALSEAEIQQSMYRSITGSETGLIAYNNFDNTSGTILQDFIGNGIEGIMVNMDGNTDWIPSAAFNTWLNTLSTQYSLAGNWSRNAVPGVSDHVGIYNLGGAFPLLSSSIGLNSLFLDNGVTLALENGQNLTLAGNLFNNGTFNINSGSSFISGSVANTGTVNVEHTLVNDHAWHLISIPNAATTAGTFYGMYLQQWSEPDASWLDIIDPATQLIPARGYSLWSAANENTFTYSGTPNNGNIAIATFAEGTGGLHNGANLLGNPYPSWLNWDAVAGYGSKYTWNGIAYDAYTAVGGYGAGSQYVAPMEGFFIVTSSAGTFTATNAMRTHQPATKKSGQELLFENGLVLRAHSDAYNDQLWLVFNPAAAENFELENDAWKLLSNTEGVSQLWSVCPDGPLSVDVRPATQSVQLGFTNNQDGYYSIDISESAGLSHVILEDTKLNTLHKLSQQPYHFYWNNNDSQSRFILHLQGLSTHDHPASAVGSVTCYKGALQINGAKGGEVFLFNLAGQCVFVDKINDENYKTCLPAKLNSGIYLVNIINGSFLWSEKVNIIR